MAAPPGRMAPDSTVLTRRSLLGISTAAALSALAGPLPALAAAPPPRERLLHLHAVHTGETFRGIYWADGQYLGEALTTVNRVLRDYHDGEVIPIDVRLLDLLHALQQRMGTKKPFGILSAYRSPETNAALREANHNVARNSLHIKGMAVDVELSGHDPAKLRRTAQRLRAGGVGYYPRQRFLHLDVGPVRFW